jgi:hypothetical protein
VAEQVLYVPYGAGHQIVERDHTMVVRNQTVTEMRANKSGGSRH